MFKGISNTFNGSVVTSLIVILFVATILKGVVQYNKFSRVYRDIKFYINLIAMYIVYLSYNFIAYELYYIMLRMFNLEYIDNGIGGIFFKLILFSVYFFVCVFACRCIYTFLFRKAVVEFHELLFKLPSIFKSIVFGIIKLPRAILNVLILVFALNTATKFLNDESKFNRAIESSKLYSDLSNTVIIPFKYDLNEMILNIVSPIFNTFKEIQRNIQYLYNGVTIDEAMKSNIKIEEFAKESVKNITDPYEKAIKLYKDVIEILEYDNEKSQDVLNENFENLSGAIPAFESGKGICFDYASLYSSLAESIKLPTRIVVGKGFDGNQWINHAWNEVYIENLNEWIQLDTTFGETGNYFDIENFKQDHKRERIIWEFSV